MSRRRSYPSHRKSPIGILVLSGWDSLKMKPFHVHFIFYFLYRFIFHKNKTIKVEPHQLDRLIEVNADGHGDRNEK